MIYEKFKNNLLSLAPDLSAEKSHKVAVAVSGGVDSMVLLDMISKFAQEYNISIHILTINHNLRENGKRDAEFVLAHSVPHICKILTWEHDGIDSNIQAQARDARYRLLTDYCKEHNIDILLTAHHADDQIENFFIKLSRGASIYSLANNKIGIYAGVQILRPFDCIFKSEIELYAAENNILFVEDESNFDRKYLRNEIRKKLKVFFSDSKHLPEELFKNRFLMAIDNITRATKSLEYLIEKCIKDAFEINGSEAVLHISKYRLFMQEEQMRALVLVLQKISGNNTNIRIHSVRRLYDAIMGDEKFTLTLHGCIIRYKSTKSFVHISKEY
jgi:tRNA(Ile)-lysidine synthase